MKAAFWGIALIVLGALGIVLVDLFGNIAVTNQLNYTTMKNAVEASMLDAVSQKYLSGFCLCTDKDKTNGHYKFTSQNDYVLLDVTYSNGKMTCKSQKKNCNLIKGDRRIDKEIFAESFIRRFASMVNNTKNYEIVFQEIIEYPPKVSVQVNSKDDEFLPTDRRDGFTIVNQMDSVIESWDGTKIIEITPTPKPATPKPSTPKPSTPKPSTPKPSTPKPADGNFGGCFLAGTKVTIKNGYKAIDKLTENDYVLTYNSNTNANEYKKVTYIFEYNDLHETLYTIKTSDAMIILTGEHNVYIKRDGKNMYVAAESIKNGDQLMYSDGTYHYIIKITSRAINEPVYNLEVEGNNNFYVGDKKILVHSAKRIDPSGDEIRGDARCDKSSCG